MCVYRIYIYIYIKRCGACVQQDTKACKRDSEYIAGFRIDTCSNIFASTNFAKDTTRQKKSSYFTDISPRKERDDNEILMQFFPYSPNLPERCQERGNFEEMQANHFCNLCLRK